MLFAPSDLHYDWDAYLNRLYKRPAVGMMDEHQILRKEENQFAHLTAEFMKGVDIMSSN